MRLEENYLLDLPEELVERKSMPEVEPKIVLKREEEKEKKKVIQADVLVIGAGISGMQAALDIADKGFKVVVVERSSSIGGSMVKLDKTFPTNDCSICTAAPKMVELARHPNVKLITYAEVEKLEGKPGDFTVTVWRKTRYVDPDKCTGCGDCAKVCPVEVPSKFDEKITTRKAIYIEFPQAVPIVYTIDVEHCIGCGSCDRVCEAKAISFLEKSEEIKIKVGSIIVATGFEVFEPLELRKEYGYGKYENVITAMQFERLLSSFGPTGGKILRLSDGKKPKSIAWIQCVGSRSLQLGYPYCSRVCCMYATKEAMITKEMNPEIDVTIFYMDLRAYGKDFQQYYDLARKKGVNYIRARPSAVYENPDKSITIKYKDTLTGEVKEKTVDLLVLSTAIVPASGNKKLGKILGIEVDENGFFKEQSLLLNPVKSTKDGIFLAGCAQGPKDIPDSVSMASGAAAEAVALVKDRERKIGKEFPEERDVSKEEPRIGVFVCHCGKNIAGFLDVKRVVEHAKGLKNVVHAEDLLFACSEDSCRRIKEIIKEKKLNRIVVAACSPTTHAPLFQDILREAGLNKYLFEMANIRNQCSWVHSDYEEATRKAMDLVRAAVAKARLLKPLHEERFPVKDKVLIIGGGVSGMTSALSLARMGIRSVIIEKEDELGGRLRDLYTLFPSDIKAEDVIKPLIEEVRKNKLIEVLTKSQLVDLEGFIGNYTARIKQDGKERKIEVGTIIVATGCREIDIGSEYSYGKDERIISQIDLEKKIKNGELKKVDTIVFINCVAALDEKHPHCCRVGCGVSIKNAKLIKQMFPDSKVYILYKDMRIFGKREEEYYGEVIGKYGVITIRYGDRKPEVIPQKDKVKVRVFDEIMREEVEIPADLVVLTINLQGESLTEKLKQILKVPADQAGFFLEAHAKIRPLDFSTDGIYLCGSAHYPKNLADAIAQAKGAASRAAIPIMQGFVTSEGIVAEVNEDLCSGCRICESICPYSAIEMKPYKGDEKRLVASVNEALCKGCGSCAAACPSGAIDQRGYTNEQIEEMVKVILEGAG